MKVPLQLQSQLALLWRALNIIRNIDDTSVVEFYKDFLIKLKNNPQLSLSAYWDEKYYSCGNNLVGITNSSNFSESKHSCNTLLSRAPELAYLNNQQDAIDFKHDPLNLIRNLYETATVSIPNVSKQHRDILLTASITIAVKSGRASYLLNAATLLITNEDNFIDVDPFIMKELYDYIIDAENINNINKVEMEVNCAVNNLNNTVENIDSSRSSNIKGGLLLSFGKSDHGKLGHGDAQSIRLIPTVVDALKDISIVKMASMSTYAIAIDVHGAVYVWGTGGSAGSLHSSKVDIQPQLLEALPLRSKVVDVSCGLGHALFLLDTGRVLAWGNGGNGRLGIGDVGDRTEASPIASLHHEVITAIQCGASHSLVLTNQGKVYSWGKNSQGQCGLGHMEDTNRPALIRKLDEITIIELSAGWEHSIVLSSDGKLYSFGCGYKDIKRNNAPPVLGLGHSDCRISPECISSIDSIKITKIVSGWDHALALDNKGKLLSWGRFLLFFEIYCMFCLLCKCSIYKC
jgi:alpha-tubulin suppressor-like RCC1 family protein